MAKTLDLIGQKFGHLTAQAAVRARRGRAWLCMCDCGSSVIVVTRDLRSGNTRSCGCREGFRSHGHSNTRTHDIWVAMRGRCNNQRSASYRHYGGRGIQVCARWDSYENFLADMGVAPAGLSLEREDNDGNYEPGNCRWATRKEQMRNTRANRRITFRGETRLLVEWAEHFGIGRRVLRARLQRRSEDDVLTELATEHHVPIGEVVRI